MAQPADVDTNRQRGAATPVRDLMSDRNFKRFFIAQVLHSGINGSLRFTFIWLVVTLTDNESTEGKVALALGLPALFLSLPAGAWSDRIDRKRLFLIGNTVLTVAVALFAVVIALDQATPLRSGIAALIIGTIAVINLPNLQAIVPLLVPSDRLMNGIALQNGGSQAANFLGLILGGLAIKVFGDAAGFGLLALAGVASSLLMARVVLPADAPEAKAGSNAQGMWRSMREGVSFARRTEPLRTLLVLALILGSSFAVMQIAIPRVVADTYGQGSESAGFILSAFGAGMLISSVAVAGRKTLPHGRNVAVFLGVGLGLGQFSLSWASNTWVAIAVMFAWGLNAGIAMASHRTLMQTHTPPEMMGRVMGLMMIGFAGGFPLGAIVSALLTGDLGPQGAMRVVGAATMCITIPLTWRRSMVTLR